MKAMLGHFDDGPEVSSWPYIVGAATGLPPATSAMGSLPMKCQSTAKAYCSEATTGPSTRRWVSRHVANLPPEM